MLLYGKWKEPSYSCFFIGASHNSNYHKMKEFLMHSYVILVSNTHNNPLFLLNWWWEAFKKKQKKTISLIIDYIYFYQDKALLYGLGISITTNFQSSSTLKIYYYFYRLKASINQWIFLYLNLHLYTFKLSRNIK